MNLRLTDNLHIELTYIKERETLPTEALREDGD